MSYNIKKFREKYSEANGQTVTQRGCAELIGVSQQMWATWESGVKLPSAANQRKIAELFGIEREDLWRKNPAGDEAAPTLPVPGQMPVMGLAACGITGWFKPQPLALKAPVPPYENPENLFAIIAIGPSMIPEGIKEGYLLYCDPTLEPLPGDCICVYSVDGHVTVKKFLSRDDEFIHMQGWNDPDKDGHQKVMNIDYANIYVKSIAVVVLVRRRA